MSTGSCVDCGTPIIGERPRCPACHDRHAGELDFYSHPAGDDAITARRDRHESATQILLRWFVISLLLACLVLTTIVAMQGCP